MLFALLLIILVLFFHSVQRAHLSTRGFGGGGDDTKLLHECLQDYMIFERVLRSYRSDVKHLRKYWAKTFVKFLYGRAEEEAYKDPKKAWSYQPLHLKELLKDWVFDDMHSLTPEELNKLIQYFNNRPRLDQSLIAKDPYIKDDFIYYYHYRFPLDDRIRLLIKKIDDNLIPVTATLLRYASMGLDAQHSSLPSVVYNLMYEKYGVRGEGFSSPLNSKLLPRDDCVFCSLFYSTDHYFGSLGPFSSDAMLTHQKGNWTVNPIYTTTVIEYSYLMILKTLKKAERDDMIIFFLIPKYSLTDHMGKMSVCGMIEANEHEFLKGVVYPGIGSHYMLCNSLNPVEMQGTDNIIYVFGGPKAKFDKFDEELLMKTWGSKSEEPSYSNSSFMRPEYIGPRGPQKK